MSLIDSVLFTHSQLTTDIDAAFVICHYVTKADLVGTDTSAREY